MLIGVAIIFEIHSLHELVYAQVLAQQQESHVPAREYW